MRRPTVLTALLGLALVLSGLTGITPAAAHARTDGSKAPTTATKFSSARSSTRANHSVPSFDGDGGPLDCPDPIEPCDPGGGHGGGGGAEGCNITVNDPQINRGFAPDAGPYTDVSFSGNISCTYGIGIVFAEARLIDRTPGYEGNVLAVGWVTSSGPSYISSGGQIRLWDEERYPSAREVEVQLASDLIGNDWECLPENLDPGRRFVECRTDGYTVVATGKYTTHVALPPCSIRQWEWQPRQSVGSINGRVLATPTALFEWCVTTRGHVREGSAKLVSFQANAKFPNLVTDPVTGPTPTFVQFSDNGRIAYRVSFPLTYRFNADTEVEAGAGPFTAKVTFKINESCTLSAAFTLGYGYPYDTDTTVNPCTQWRPLLGN